MVKKWLLGGKNRRKKKQEKENAECKTHVQDLDLFDVNCDSNSSSLGSKR